MDGMDADLPDFHGRLVAARARLITRIIDEDDPDRALPDTAWVRMAADLHTLICAVGDMIRDNKDIRI